METWFAATAGHSADAAKKACRLMELDQTGKMVWCRRDAKRAGGILQAIMLD